MLTKYISFEIKYFPYHLVLGH